MRDCSFIAVPNVITLNNDGINDTWQPLPEGGRSLEAEIFNRWGKRIFHSANYRNQWPDSADLPAGLYYYRLTDPLTGNTHKGWLEVIR